MPELLANIFTDLIIAGPLISGIAAAYFARQVFPDSLAPCIVIGIVAALVVGFFLKPRHEQNDPWKRDQMDNTLGPQGGRGGYDFLGE